MTTTTKTPYVQLPKVINTVELEQRKASAKENLLNGYYKPTTNGGFYSHPCAAETQSFNNIESFLSYVEQQTKLGIERYTNIPALTTPTLQQITYFKSKDEVDALIKAAEQEAEAEMIAAVEAFNQSQINLLAQQLVDNELNKENKKEEARIEALKAKALATAQAHIAQQLKEIK